jgi:hypothetical protein
LDITYVTQLSVDRLNRIPLIAERHGGPVSAAVYIKNVEEELPLIMQTVKQSQHVRRFVDFHLLLQFQPGVRNITVKEVTECRNFIQLIVCAILLQGMPEPLLCFTLTQILYPHRI